jgi:hypothetical protein
MKATEIMIVVIFIKASHFSTKASTSLKLYLKASIASHYWKTFLKCFKKRLGFFEKASHHSIPLNMYLKSLVILEKVSISLKRFSKSLTFLNKSLHFCENVIF